MLQKYFSIYDNYNDCIEFAKKCKNWTEFKNTFDTDKVDGNSKYYF